MSRKIKKNQGLGDKLPLAIKTGNVCIGFKSSLKSLIEKKSKMLIVASNFPEVKRRLLEYYAMLCGNVQMKFINGNNNELAKNCDKFFRVGVLSIIDSGEVDLNAIISQ